jgi:hypothetical protein
MGAIFLRTKLLYDFVQLPITAHETLCTSLLNLIEVFKNWYFFFSVSFINDLCVDFFQSS